ncbi:hypothetical protein DPMN_149589 [Dreissena polymorpha]|uniref:Sushi domain-containing protein n=1 Tax=Dreissena polymorpha TaxID=45954 RepID=A0A9D4J2K1_DREPO|nr:hypothetical protein DPMN_149589 [Dreissena polymorpha]
MYTLTTPNNTLYNAKVNVTCVPGYHLNQTQENHPNGTQRTDAVTEIITCADTGNWSQISGCQPKATIIIISSVIGIVVVVLIGIVIFIVLRHKYARYANSRLLTFRAIK